MQRKAERTIRKTSAPGKSEYVMIPILRSGLKRDIAFTGDYSPSDQPLVIG